MDFYKMQGAGNDFIFIEDFKYSIADECKLAKKLCDRHFGIGADGLVIVRKSDVADSKMVIINSDGSRANMCGNAIRCFGKYIYENNIINSTKFTLVPSLNKLNFSIFDPSSTTSYSSLS